jgi:glutamine synthetase adenylyltransferase
VTTRESFERYQCEQAELWEHMALLRARAVAGCCGPAQASLDRVRGRLLIRRRDPWPYVAELRQRVVRERSDPSPQEVHFKTGRGGLMDVEFLASAGMLERGGGAFPRLPSVPGMLGAAVTGPQLPPLLRDYHFLRRVESRVRWVAGRAVEAFRASGESLAASAELVCPGLAGAALLEQVAATRARIRRAYDAVVAGGSISALEAR